MSGSTRPADVGLDLVPPSDPAFEEAAMSRVFNRRRPDRRPAGVLRARSAEETGVVVAGPAVRGGMDLDPYLAELGRFFNGGHCPTVGIGGFLLQGGMGWNCRGWGWAAERIVALDVVTADGEIVRADASQNADLFWAARGSGPGFPGIVTAFHLQTLPPELGYDGSVIVVDGVCFDDDPTAAAAALAPLDTCPVAGRALLAKRCEPTDMALSMQTDLYYAAYVVHEHEVDDALTRDSLNATMRSLEPVTAGCYLGDSAFTRRPQRFLSDESFARLEEIRAARDPRGVFPSYLIADGATLNENPWEQA